MTGPSSVAEAIMELNAQLAPLYDAAEGIRADMLKRGWTPPAAEAVAMTWLTGAIEAFWAGIRPS